MLGAVAHGLGLGWGWRMRSGFGSGHGVWDWKVGLEICFGLGLRWAGDGLGLARGCFSCLKLTARRRRHRGVFISGLRYMYRRFGFF